MGTQKTNFTSDFFVGNRKKLRELFTGKAPIVITAHGLLQRNNDMAQPFRQDGNFWYLTGINEPDLILVMDKDKEYLIVPERDAVKSAFDGTIDYQALKERSGITEFMNTEIGWKQLGSRLKRVRHVATLAAPPVYVEHFDFYTNPARASLIKKMQEYNQNIELLELREHFIQMRMIKQPEELRALQESVDITVAGFTKLRENLKSLSYEYEAEALMNNSFRMQGARNGYDTIIGGGMNGCTMHYVANEEELDPKSLILVDAGAEMEYYSADITRTYAQSNPNKRQRAVHQAVIDAQDFALTLMRPGNSIRDNEKKMEQFIGEKLRELGLIKSIDHESVRRYYPHALSHYLGLDLHDLGDYGAPLAAGMALTIEPGIYIPEEGIGVRIEDDVVITSDGARVLSKALPREL